MKKNCVICGKTRGKRSCRLNPNELLCPVCCAEIRHEACQGCTYYAVAKQYQDAKAQQNVSKDEIAKLEEHIIEEVNQAFEYYEKNMIPECYNILQNLMKEHPQNPHVCFGMGTYHARQKKYDEALHYLDQAIAISPDYAEAHFNKATIYYDQADIKRLIQSYMKVLAFGDPQEDYVQKAKKAVEKFRRKLRDENTSLENFFKGHDAFEQGMEAMSLSNWKKAIQLFQKSISYYQKFPQPYNNMGICYGKLGQKDLALQSFDKALEIDPNYEPAIVTRMAVDALKDGGKISDGKIEIIDYYKDYSSDNKSYIKSLIDRSKSILE